MNAKNLWLRFGLVGLLVLLCLWPLVAKRGLRWGIDLRGGHSLIFEIRTNEAEIKRLSKQKDELTAALAKATGEAEKKEIRAKLARVETDLKRCAEQDSEASDLPQQMIALLKQRVDPLGLASLEWRPLGSNRIEIRMPAGKVETRRKRDAFFEAMDRLEEGNIQRSDIRRVLQAAPDQRQGMIERLTRIDPDQTKRFEKLVKAYDAMIAAEDALKVAKDARSEALRASKAPANLDELDGAVAAAAATFDNAQVAYEDALAELEAGNVNRQELHLTLENYYQWEMQKAQAAGTRQPSKSRDFASNLVIVEIDTSQRLYETSLENLRKRYPARAKEIDEVFELFQAWSKVRQRLDDPADLKRLIAKAGVLEFRIAPVMPGTKDGSRIELSEAEYQRYVQSLKTEGPDALRNRNERLQWFPIHGQSKSGKQRYILLYNQPGYQMLHQRRGGWALTNATFDHDEYGRPAVAFELNEAGAGLMAKLTAAHQTHPLAILLDDEVYSAPFIREGAIISDRGIISGSFTPEEVSDLVSTLRAGSLPAKLNPEPVSENSFGPSIGAVNRDMGFRAAYWGLIIVASFMLVYYLLAGAIADMALLLNVILILGAMSWFGAVFTLPGIAGVILTIGIAVDANVLIFERLREEQTKGQSVRMAMRNAYERAFSAIFDANITTLLTCLILGWVGTEEVRGFAITLGLGVMFSMFSALVVTRWVFQLLLDLRIIRKPIPMLRIIGVPKIDWMSKRRVFWVLSILFVAMGVASLVRQGSNIWGIQFSSGSQVLVSFRDDALIPDPATGEPSLPDDALVRDLFKAEAGKLGYDKLQATASVETRLDRDQARNFLRDYDDKDNPDGRISLAEWRAHGKSPAFFAKLDANGDGFLDSRELAERLPPLSYQISTTETVVEHIRQTASGAFGEALEVRTAHEFSVAGPGRVQELGVEVPPDGRIRVTPELRAQAAAAYRQDMIDFEGGGMIVVRQITPPISQDELAKRIREMRAQPDYRKQMFTKTRLIGLTPAGEGRYSAFAVLVYPAELAMTEEPAAWAEFFDEEARLLGDALAKGAAMPTTNFDAEIAGETAQLAVIAIVLSWLAIVVYLWFRFGSVTWGLAAVICLIHDVVIVVGMVAASSWLSSTSVGQALGIQSFKVDLAMVAAFLTVIGYSVNDTIVIFDRIRENRGKLTTVSEQVINASVNQTLSRTLLTTGTTFIVVMVMYVMGGAGLHAFNYALLVGILFGTYSSVAVASPLLMGFRKAVATRVVAPVGRE